MFKSWAIGAGLILAIAVPLALASFSPLLQWRDPIYIGSGLAGILAMGLMLAQPVLAAGYLKQFSPVTSRHVHRVVGIVLVLAVMSHVVGLWITSPPDVIDVLLFRSPTPFSVWGALAMWALFAAAIFALLRRPLKVAPRIWRRGHAALTSIAIAGTVAHVLLIEGTMEQTTKIILSILAVVVAIKAMLDLRIFPLWRS